MVLPKGDKPMECHSQAIIREDEKMGLWVTVTILVARVTNQPRNHQGGEPSWSLVGKTSSVKDVTL